MERLSPHITMAEAVHSNTAKRLGIENKPNPEQIASMLTIAEMIFEPLRVFVGGPIKINSFFRSPALNKAVGGATKNGKPTSQHCKGEAMDLDDVYGHASNAQMFDWIRANLDFDHYYQKIVRLRTLILKINLVVISILLLHILH